MAIPKILKNASGEWRGTSKLHLSWLPKESNVQTSDSTVTVFPDQADSHVAIAYQWQHEGEQCGTFLLCGSDTSGIVTGGWTDSWHQNTAVMQLAGTGNEDDHVKLAGTYQVEGHPDWGWRIEFERPSEDTLVMKMFNVSPDGEEEWAVSAEYRRDA